MWWWLDPLGTRGGAAGGAILPPAPTGLPRHHCERGATLLIYQGRPRAVGTPPEPDTPAKTDHEEESARPFRAAPGRGLPGRTSDGTRGGGAQRFRCLPTPSPPVHRDPARGRAAGRRGPGARDPDGLRI